MTQKAESQKYIPTSIVVIPEDDGRLTVMEAYNTRRTFIDTFTDEELLEWLRQTFAENLRRSEAEQEAHMKRVRAIEQAPVKKLTLDLTF